jgi:hypothetical protein
MPSVQPQILTKPKILHDRRGKTDDVMHETDDIMHETDGILHETDRFLPLNRTKTGCAKNLRFPQGFSY